MTIPTAATIAEWRALADTPIPDDRCYPALGEAADICEGLLAMLAVREARIAALEAERDDVARRLIIMDTDAFQTWNKEHNT